MECNSFWQSPLLITIIAIIASIIGFFFKQFLNIFKPYNKDEDLYNDIEKELYWQYRENCSDNEGSSSYAKTVDCKCPLDWIKYFKKDNIIYSDVHQRVWELHREFTINSKYRFVNKKLDKKWKKFLQELKNIYSVYSGTNKVTNYNDGSFLFGLEKSENIETEKEKIIKFVNTYDEFMNYARKHFSRK